jgi:hypothetical protein
VFVVVMYSGEYDVCGVTLTVYPHPAGLHTQSSVTNII